MTVRFYSSVAQVSALTVGITNAQTTMTLTTVSGWPTSTPFTAVIDPDTPTAEIVNVSNTAGTTYTIQRGIDGSSAVAHNSAAVVRHMATARDFADSRSHENAVADVHGIGPTASLVGTTTSQTLTNKTLTSPIINSGTFNNITTGAWTSFTPTIQGAGGVAISGTAPTINAGRYSKVGRLATVHMDFQGNGGVIVPGGGSAIITWNLPATLAPVNPPGGGFVTGTFVVNFIFGLGMGQSLYTNGYNGFRGLFDNGGVNEFFDGSDVTSGVIVSLDISYETAT